MNGNIYINGVIGTFLDDNGNVVEKGVELLDVILQVRNQPKAESFTVYINSPGGMVDTGFEIYDYLKGLSKPITTIGQGMVASIATVIFMAGQTRKLKPHTDFMIHLPSGGIDGNSNDIEAFAKYIKEVEKRIVKFYNETAGLNDTEIIPLLNKETYLKGDEAFKLGFATEKTIVIEPVAYFQKPNSKTNNMSKQERGFMSKVKDLLKSFQITNKIVFDAENKELDFFELEDSATIELGTKANYDGKPANGDYKVPSEEDPSIVLTYVFDAGILTEIKEPEAVAEDDPETDEEMTALKAENETLKTQLAEYDGKVIDLTGEVTALKDSNKSYKKAIAAIKALETSHVPDAPEKKKQTTNIENVKNDVSYEVANWKKNKQLKKIK